MTEFFLNGRITFHCMYMPHFLIHSPVCAHLGCYHLLAVVNNAVMNTGIEIYLRNSYISFFRYIPRNEIAGLRGSFVL